MVVGGAQDDALGFRYLTTQLENILRIGAFILVAVAENQIVVEQVNQICLDAELLGAFQSDCFWYYLSSNLFLFPTITFRGQYHN